MLVAHVLQAHWQRLCHRTLPSQGTAACLLTALPQCALRRLLHCSLLRCSLCCTLSFSLSLSLCVVLCATLAVYSIALCVPRTTKTRNTKCSGAHSATPQHMGTLVVHYGAKCHAQNGAKCHARITCYVATLYSAPFCHAQMYSVAKCPVPAHCVLRKNISAKRNAILHTKKCNLPKVLCLIPDQEVPR
jgi:hypothetical protein